MLTWLRDVGSGVGTDVLGLVRGANERVYGGSNVDRPRRTKGPLGWDRWKSSGERQQAQPADGCLGAVQGVAKFIQDTSLSGSFPDTAPGSSINSATPWTALTHWAPPRHPLWVPHHSLSPQWSPQGCWPTGWAPPQETCKRQALWASSPLQAERGKVCEQWVTWSQVCF